MAFIGVLTLIASCVASWLKQLPVVSLFGALIIALLIGMAAQFPVRSWYVGDSADRKAGVKDAAGSSPTNYCGWASSCLDSNSTCRCCSPKASNACRLPWPW